MLHNVHRGVALATAVGLAVTGCSDGSGSESDEATPVETSADEPDGDVAVTTTESTEPGGDTAMSVDELCEPVEGEVAAWAGAPMTPEHNTVYADAAEPILVCKWVVDGADRSIRVDYVGVPDSFMLDLVDGNQDRTDVIAPNLHDKASFFVIAPNGWGVVVSNLGADRSEDVDAMVVIANAALAQIGS